MHTTQYGTVLLCIFCNVFCNAHFVAVVTVDEGENFICIQNGKRGKLL